MAAVVLEVELVDAYGAEIAEAFCRDEPRLSSRPSRLKPEALADMLASSAYQLLIARNAGGICATLTLAVYRAPGGVKARIDDLVAEQSEDGQAAAVALIQHAVRRAVVAGAPVIRLVSKPTLPVANSTYERLGFTLEGPTIYRRAVQP
jgi:GNAT superfamily N-acetyltransferase